MKRFFLLPIEDVLGGLEPLVRVKSPFRALGPPMISVIVIWFLYVPPHEIYHVSGCLIAGGYVDRLEMSAIYGASYYAKIFPFIHTGSDYAGQLTGFDTHGSDFCFFVTDFMPYVMTLLFGVTCIKLSRRKRRPILFGIGVVIGLAPFYNIPGDYYEMGSTITTRVFSALNGVGNPPLYEGIRSDDIFKLWEFVFTKPGEIGLDGAKSIAIGVVLIGVSFVVDVLLAFCTYWVGHFISLIFVQAPARKTPSKL